MEWEPQYPNAPSNPTSLPNQAAGTNAARSEKVPTLKQISPSPAVSALSKLTDDELRRKGVDDLLRILRRVEGDYKSLLGEHGSIVKDVNRRLQIYVLETRGLKEVNQKLQDDNQELRDLCCFLDDDRQRGRKLAREWQRFGRYTASVMRSEVAVYQEKLRELEDKQNELITENMELKELCLFLDQERVRMNGDRDEGDGSSNGTVTGHEDGIVSMETISSANPNTPANDSYPISASSAASYIRELELKVSFLEQEKKLLSQKVDRNSADGLDIISSVLNRSGDAGHLMLSGKNQSLHGLKPGSTLLRKSPVSSKPETVMHAMKVLQVHEELEKTPTEEDNLGDPEKAIVREMCNVVWRTLGDVGDIGSFNESSDSIHEPPFLNDSTGRSNFSKDLDPPYINAHTFNYDSTQPQSVTANAPVTLGLKQSNVGNQALPGPRDSLLGPTSYGPSQNNNSSKPLQDSKQHQSSQPPLTQAQNEPTIRNRQNSLSERLATERGRNVSSKQSYDRPDYRRNPEQIQSYYAPEFNSQSSNPQQFTNQPPPQQPFVPSLHLQQHSLPDMNSNAYTLQRPIDMATKPGHISPQYQQPPVHQHQQRLSEKSTHSQKSTDLITRPQDQAQHYQQRPSPSQQSSSHYANQNQQRSVEPHSNKQHSGNIYAQQGNELSNATNYPGNPSQHQRNSQPRPHQQVKLLDAPGSQRNFQRPAPAQGLGHNDRLHEEFEGQTKSQGRDIDGSTERDPQIYPRSVSTSSASSIMHPHNSQIPPHNMQSGKSTQNVIGPSVFRAYPPQLTSMPTQSVSMGVSQAQELSSGSNNPSHSDPTRGSYSLESQSQNKGSLPNKRFQEQEWRQNFLDDSDTL